MKKIPQEIIDLLRSPLPVEALTEIPSKSFLTGIKPIYIIERLNNAFGIGGWIFKTELINIFDKHVVVKGYLTIPEYELDFESFGGNTNSDIGDSFKGASTDALTKIASYMEIGIDVFKGIQKINGFKSNNNYSKKELIRKKINAIDSIDSLKKYWEYLSNVDKEDEDIIKIFHEKKNILKYEN